MSELHDANIMTKFTALIRKLIRDENKGIKADKEFTGIVAREPTILGYVDIAPYMTVSELTVDTPYIPNVRTDPDLRCRLNDEVLCVAINGDMNNVRAVMNKNVLNKTVRLPYRTVSNNATLKISDVIVYCNANSGGFTITLPDASKCDSACIEFVRVDSTSNNVTVVGSSGQLINGLSNMLVNTTYPKRWIQSIKTGWWII